MDEETQDVGAPADLPADPPADLSVDDAADIIFLDDEGADAAPAKAAPEADIAGDPNAGEPSNGQGQSPAAPPAGPPAELVEATDADGRPVKLSKAALVELSKAHLSPAPEITALQDRYVQTIEAGMALLQRQTPQPLTLAEIDRILAEDPLDGPAVVVRRQTEIAEHGEKMRALQQAHAAEQVQRHQELTRHVAAERDKLLTAIPAWRDKETARREQAEVRDYLSKSGFNADEIDHAYDSRMIVVAHKAAAYDRLMAARPAVNAKAAKAPPYLAPGPGRGAGLIAAFRERFARSGSVDDAAALIHL